MNRQTSAAPSRRIGFFLLSGIWLNQIQPPNFRACRIIQKPTAHLKIEYTQNEKPAPVNVL